MILAERDGAMVCEVKEEDSGAVCGDEWAREIRGLWPQQRRPCGFIGYRGSVGPLVRVCSRSARTSGSRI